MSETMKLSMGEVCADERVTKGRPDPEWVRGRCPLCGEDVVSNCYYVGGKGYIIIWECWASLGEKASCDYRRVL
jgi:hypothetical protein